MRKVWLKHKWLLLVISNILPFVMNVLVFITGILDDIFVLLPLIFGLTVVNFLTCKKISTYILFQVIMLVCIIISVDGSMHLYCRYISDDFMSVFVGKLFLLLEASMNVVATGITVVIKAINNKAESVRHGSF